MIDERKSFWLRIGTAWKNRDGSLNIRLNALPLNGALQVRKVENEETGTSALAVFTIIPPAETAQQPAQQKPAQQKQASQKQASQKPVQQKQKSDSYEDYGVGDDDDVPF